MGRKTVIQQHHVSYDPPVVVTVTRGEHYLLTQLNRHKHIGKGFITALDWWIAENRSKAEELVYGS